MAKRTYRISFDWSTMKFTGLDYEQDIKPWEILFPDVDIVQEFVEMAVWLNKNRDNKKSKKRNWHRFINDWLKKEQRKAVGL
jgi:hypothetical protein